MLGSAIGCQGVPRANNVTCVNDSGVPIEVMGTGSGGSMGCSPTTYTRIYVNGVLIAASSGCVGELSASAVIPIGASYKISGPSLYLWAELR